MEDKIRVLIVDDLPETRENVRKLLQFEADIEVSGQAGDGQDAIEQARATKPDVILMDINMPGLDGISASQTIASEVPHTQIIIMSVQSEADYLRRAMLAGARDFLMKPFTGDELIRAIRRVHETRPVRPVAAAAPMGGSGGPTGADGEGAGHVITVFSPKGGSGCSTIAINLAVALALDGRRTAILDGSLQFGDVSVMLNLKPTTSIVDIVDRIDDLETDLISSVALAHESGLKVLLAPPRPEMADRIEPEHFEKLILLMRTMFDYIIIDTSSALDDITLALLDAASRILLVTQQSLPSLTNASRFFDLTEELDYTEGKLLLVVNRASSKLRISVKDVADTLKKPVIMAIPSDELIVGDAANQGKPLVTGTHARRPVAIALTKLAERIREQLEVLEDDGEAEPSGVGSRLARLFGSR